MTDRQILDVFNDGVIGAEQMRCEMERPAIEVLPARPQIEFVERSGQWVPRRDVVRCRIEGADDPRSVTIRVDEHELSLEEFGTLLSTHEGWGMRLTFAAGDEVQVSPEIEVRDPDAKKPKRRSSLRVAR